MKLLVLLPLLFLAIATCYGGIKLPRGTYAIDELDAAKQQAAEDGEPIAFLYTNKDSTCGLCNRAATMIIDELKSSTVLVYTDSKQQSPGIVSKALSERGKYIPKVAVFDSSIEEQLGLVIYEEIKQDGDDAFDDLKKRIRAYKKAAHPKKREVSRFEATKSYAERTWTNESGASFKGSFVSATDDTVTIRRSSDKREFTVQQSILSDADQTYINENR